MRYMLTGDHWGAEEAYRMGVIQEIAPNPAKALEAGIGLAQKIAACGPLGIKTTLESAHLSIDESEAAAFARLNEQFGGLFHTEDFIEGRKAEAEGRPPSTKASRWARVPGDRCLRPRRPRATSNAPASQPRGVALRSHEYGRAK
jgi:1,4-dihydroxy-2-naphthoyl-CoA synthase